MKRIFALLPLLLLCGVSAFAQRVDGPITYPAMRTPDSELAQAFDASFEERNVGFLHIYNDLDIQPDAFFAGVAMSEDFYGLLPGKYRRRLLKDQAEVFSVYAVRAVAGNLYLVRFEDDRRGQRMELFDLEDGELEHVTTLAQTRCNKRNCFQLDSWITDVDRDGRLDIVQRARKTRAATGEVRREKSAVYQQQPDGTFERNRQLQPDWASYEFAEIERTK
jgi:hypothetical protein